MGLVRIGTGNTDCQLSNLRLCLHDNMFIYSLLTAVRQISTHQTDQEIRHYGEINSATIIKNVNVLNLLRFNLNDQHLDDVQTCF